VSDKDTYGRQPVVIVELIQPRCSNRFGVLPCTAAGTPKCYNTYWTCGDKANYNTDGEIVWRFSRVGDPVDWLYEETDANNIKTNAIPCLVSATTTSSRINPGAARTGESPLGRRATATIVIDNVLWDDHIGDFYLADRPGYVSGQPPPNLAGFWDLFAARNAFTPGFEAVIYEGYAGQALSAMQARRFDVEQIIGPNGSDQFTVECRDPLDAIRGKNAKYPPTSQIDLAANISASDTAIQVTCLEAELDLVLGNTAAFYATIGDEVLSYTGYTGTEPVLTLTGVVRGVLGTTAAAHSADDAVQRSAYHLNQRLYDVARYILQDHTTVKNSYIDDAQWDDEGDTYLSTLTCNTLLPRPEPVEVLLGELGRDGMFSIWWDDRLQTIPIKAVRPPKETPATWTDENNIVSFSKVKKIDDRMTRVSIFFAPRNFLDELEESKNYENRRIRIDAEVESASATGGKIVENVIYSRWTQSFNNARLVGASLLKRYRLPPEYVTLTLDAKDRDVNLADVVDLTTRYIKDTEGVPVETRWEVISVEEPSPGSKVQVGLQSYTYVGLFSVIMENTAPDFATATDEEKENGCWIAENTGLMPDGTEGYLLQ
jgi:hypothetical protein